MRLTSQKRFIPFSIILHLIILIINQSNSKIIVADKKFIKSLSCISSTGSSSSSSPLTSSPSTTSSPIYNFQIFKSQIETLPSLPPLASINLKIIFNKGFHGQVSINSSQSENNDLTDNLTTVTNPQPNKDTDFKNSYLKLTFSKSFFIDLDEINRLKNDKISSLYQKKIIASRYPIDIEQPEWLSENFSVYLQVFKTVHPHHQPHHLSFPIHLRYHKSTFNSQTSRSLTKIINLKFKNKTIGPVDIKFCSFRKKNNYKFIKEDNHDHIDQDELKVDWEKFTLPVGNKFQLELALGISGGTIFLTSIIILKNLF